MNITYKLDVTPPTDAIIAVYESSGINRPVTDAQRISKMYANSNLIATAWHNNLLVGISRSLTDFCYSCYLSDLAVRNEYQHHGIGKTLIALTKEKLGDECMLLLLAAPSAINYYPKIGMDKLDNAFLINRKY